MPAPFYERSHGKSARGKRCHGATGLAPEGDPEIEPSSAVATDVRGGRSTVGWRAGKVSHPSWRPRLLA